MRERDTTTSRPTPHRNMQAPRSAKPPALDRTTTACQSGSTVGPLGNYLPELGGRVGVGLAKRTADSPFGNEGDYNAHHRHRHAAKDGFRFASQHEQALLRETGGVQTLIRHVPRRGCASRPAATSHRHHQQQSALSVKVLSYHDHGARRAELRRGDRVGP